MVNRQKMSQRSKKPAIPPPPYPLFTSEAGMLLKINGMGKALFAARAKTEHIEQKKRITWKVTARSPAEPTMLLKKIGLGLKCKNEPIYFQQDTRWKGDRGQAIPRCA